MPAPTTTIVSPAFAEQIDELSTRMMLSGAASLGAADFDRLSRTASELGLHPAAEIADRIARQLASSTFDPPELTALVDSGLAELSEAVDGPVAAPSAPMPGGPTAGSQALAPEFTPPALDVELIREFITESNEHLTAIESQLLTLEKDASATEPLNAIFRGFHTIKGLAGFFELTGIQSLAHEVETLLALARTARLTITPSIADVVLESTDVLRRELAAIARRLSGEIVAPSKIDSALLHRVRSAASGTSPAESLSKLPQAAVPAALGLTLQTETAAERLKDERRIGDRSSVRIETAKLDHLMDTVGEMVIAQTLVGHNPLLASIKDARMQRNLSQLARLTADVQRITTAMRMVPIGLQFRKTARLVRDLARHAGKQIVFETEGEETELDKTIAEELSDPLLHMVRNSVDHGIETAEERIALGKSPAARIRVSAHHRSGQIVVSVTDDGRGLNREKILARAFQSGLAKTSEQLADSEIFAFIFAPGFSTAEKVTDISGRGVGMDVVHKQVQKLRGRVDIQSKPGEGTAFHIKLPLTLAIIEGLVVGVGRQRYIVPLFSVREMFRPTPEMLSTVQGRGEMALVRGGLMPIVRLHRMFEVERGHKNLSQGILIVSESEGRRFCLFVDELIGKQEVVIKGLGERFRHVTGVAGCAILGDGHVGLILDVDGLYPGRI